MPNSIKSLITTDVDLQPYNTLNISARAHRFAAVESVEQLQELLTTEEISESKHPLVLGDGSNMLFTNDVDRLVLHIEIKGKEVVKETTDHVWLKVGAGENWHQTVRYCVDHEWGGIENLSLIPGTVGAAPIQNIGAYGVELEEVFEELEAVKITTGEIHTFQKKDCRFGYRNSIFKNEHKGEYVITKVILKLSKKPKLNTSYGVIRAELKKRGITDPTIRDISDIIIDIRNSKLPNPKELGNAGSFFKNPIISEEEYKQIRETYPDIPGYPMDKQSIKVPAGWLIEQAGWKGKVIDNTGTYKKQALVIVNYGDASGEEILKLSLDIQNSIKDQFGIALEPEVNIID